MDDMPEFLRRTPQKETVMTQQTPENMRAQADASASTTRKRRQDAYVATVRIAIPLDMSDAESLSKAIKAVQGIEAGMPAGAMVKIDASLGKV